MPVLYGVFLYMGCAALRGMQVCLFILSLIIEYMYHHVNFSVLKILLQKIR